MCVQIRLPLLILSWFSWCRSTMRITNIDVCSFQILCFPVEVFVLKLAHVVYVIGHHISNIFCFVLYKEILNTWGNMSSDGPSVWWSKVYIQTNNKLFANMLSELLCCICLCVCVCVCVCVRVCAACYIIVHLNALTEKKVSKVTQTVNSFAQFFFAQNSLFPSLIVFNDLKGCTGLNQ